MSRSGCSICASKATRDRVDAGLLAGIGVRKIAAEIGCSKSLVHLHKMKCLVPAVSQATKENGRYQSSELLGKLDNLLGEAMAVVRRAKTEKNDVLLLRALSEARDTVRLMGDFTGVRPEPPAQLSYTIVFEGGRPVARKDTIELSAANAPALKDAD